MRTIICRHCGKVSIANRKLKHLHQRYCGDKECQHARKLEFERIKFKNDSAFRSRKLEKGRCRRKMMAELDPLSGSHYQHDYRITHPEYTSTNRQKQQVRNSGTKAGRSPETKIVNPDALMLQTPDNDRIYAMIAVDNKMIVNPDAFVKECIDMEQIAKVKPMLVRLL